MSIKAAFIAYETNRNTNPLIAAVRAAGVTAKYSDIIKAAEEAATSGSEVPVRKVSGLLERRADQFVAAIAKL